MQLEVLTGGDVANAVGVLLSQVGEGVHLGAVEPAARDLDALHARSVPGRVRALGVPLRKIQLLRPRAVEALAVVVALTVGAAAQAGLGEDDFVELVLLAQPDLSLEDIDLAPQVFRDAAPERFLPRSGLSH